MGCFSVSCGVTRLSIREGDKCVLIPITTDKIYERELGQWGSLSSKRIPYTEHATTHLFCYNTELWHPCLLPIHGEYNDYGSIEDIVEDDNTRALEEYFGMPIADIVALITDGRNDVYEKYSFFYDKYFGPKDMLEAKDYGGMFKSICQEERYDGLTCYKTEKANIFLQDDGVFVAYEKDSHLYPYSRILDFFKDYYARYQILLGVTDEKCHMLMCIGGMFVLEEVYDKLSKSCLKKQKSIVNDMVVDNLFLQEAGFEYVKSDDEPFALEKKLPDCTLRINENGKEMNGQKYFYIKEFARLYKKLSGEPLDLSCYDWKDEREVKKYLLEKRFLPGCSERLRRDGVEDISAIRKWYKENSYDFMNTFLANKLYLMESEEIMAECYLPYILKGTCLQEYIDFERFSYAINLMNVVYMPSFCATQCGCFDAENKLSYITSSIVKERAEKIAEDWDGEGEAPIHDPEEGFNKMYY